MALELFADTSGFYALLVAGDDAHAAASRRMEQAARSRERIVTTDYVLDETATLLKARGFPRAARTLFEVALKSEACAIVWMDALRFAHVRRFWDLHEDQAWSFTDCASFQVMRERGIRQALTKDRHFAAAGFEPVL